MGTFFRSSLSKTIIDVDDVVWIRISIGFRVRVRIRIVYIFLMLTVTVLEKKSCTRLCLFTFLRSPHILF